MSDSLTLSRVAEAIALAERDNAESHCAEVAFSRRLAKHPEILSARLGRIRHVLRVMNVDAGGVLLDVGSGIGLNSVLSLMCGVREVHSVEMSPDRLRSAEIIVQRLGVPDRMHLHGQDVLTLELPSQSIDAAFSFELLEHVSDIAALYRNLSRWVKPGAAVYGRTGANGRNLIYRRTFRKTWDVIDKEHYTAVREDIIRELVPDAPGSDVALLVERTRGALKGEIRRVAEEYRTNRALPAPRSPCAPRDPLTGQYMERLLDPYEIIGVMDSQGFRTSLVKPNFENITTANALLAAAQRSAGVLIRLGHPASLVVAPWLEFLSVRRSPRTGNGATEP